MRLGGLPVVGMQGKSWMCMINKWSYEAEGLVHGTPSGIDNTISVFGEEEMLEGGEGEREREKEREGYIMQFYLGGAIKFKSGTFTHIEK